MHILTGCDVTGKIGAKAFAYKYISNKLSVFPATEVLTDQATKVAEKYLVQVVDHCDDSKTFDELI